MAGADLSIAVVGLAGRFPGASDVEALWRTIRNGEEAIRRFEVEELRQAGVDEELLRDPRYVPARGVLDDAFRFDTGLFNMSPRQAEATDPQQRVFLEVVWECLEDAGHVGGPRTAVFAGAGLSTYLMHALDDADLRSAVGDLGVILGNDKDYLATRLSYLLGFEGPSVTVQTACSTSLVAIHHACQSLLGGECDLAVAGGVSIAMPQTAGYLYQEGGTLSRDGHCRAFDGAATGLVRGNGAGAVALKRLVDARADGDRVRAVILGSAVNNDGKRRVGFTAPSVEGQAAVVRSAHVLAGIDPATVSYVEAHGTGTPLGDPVEVEALNRAFRAGGDSSMERCALGSLKTNIGHLDAAAGVAGLIKAVLALDHGVLPPSLHFETPNPEIDFASGPFYVNAQLRDWAVGDGPRRAGVSSFGMGGTNAHVILEEAPEPPPPEPARPWQILPVSAADEAGLGSLAGRLADRLREVGAPALADTAYTLQVGRRHLRRRRAVVTRSNMEAARELAGDPRSQGGLGSGHAEEDGRPVTFLFTGQGVQRTGSYEALYSSRSEFRRWLDRGSEQVEATLGVDLRRLFCAAEPGGGDEVGRRLRDTRLAQPSLFVLAYALARQWRAWGVDAVGMFGHSLGEYVAACLADVFTYTEALDLVTARGRIIAELAGGDMLAVAAPVAEIEPLVGDGLAMAAVNGPDRCVVSGAAEAVASLAGELGARSIRCRTLPTSHAFHSPAMADAVEPLTAAVAGVELKPPRRRWLSGVTGTWVRSEDVTDPEYWGRHHLLRTVRFDAVLKELFQEPRNLLLEVGPGRTLSDLARRHPERPPSVVAISTLTGHGDAEAEMLQAAGRLWTEGGGLDWEALHSHRRRRVSLPAYPFAGGEYRVGRRRAPGTNPPLRRTAWSLSSLAAAGERRPQPTAWRVLHSGDLLAHRVVARLSAGGRKVVESGPGTMGAGRPAGRPGEGWIDLRALSGDPAVDAGTAWDTVDERLGELEAWTSDREDGGPPVVVATRGACRPAGRGAPVDGALYLAASAGRGFQAVDLDPEASPDDAAAALVAELARGAGRSPVALRRSGRWWRESIPVAGEPPPPSGTAHRVGTCLVSGGGDAELEVAGELIRRLRPATVLVATGRATAATAAQRSAALPSVAEIEDKEAAIIAADPETRPLEDWGDFLADLDRWAARRLIAYLREGGVETAPGARHGVAALHRALGILPRFAKLFDHVLTLLADSGWLRREGEQVVMSRPGEAGSPHVVTRRDLEKDYPELAWVVERVESSIAAYPSALSGEAEALAVLFPGGELRRPGADGQFTKIWERPRYIDLLAEIVAESVIERAAMKDRGPVRILEVGGGTGALSRRILGRLDGVDYEYHFTDIGKAFVLAAEEWTEEEGYDAVEFGIFDISRDPLEQGFRESDFDVVVGLDVVHATSDLRGTVGHLVRLMSPGAVLGLVESLRVDRWIHLTAGLAEGWWYFDDDLRQHSPLVKLDTWATVLRHQGLEHIRTLPRGARRGSSQAGILLATAPAAATTALEERLRSWRRLGAEVREVCLDLAAGEGASVLEGIGDLVAVVHGVGAAAGNPFLSLRRLEEGLGGRAPEALAVAVIESAGEEAFADALAAGLEAAVPERRGGPGLAWHSIALERAGVGGLAAAAGWLPSADGTVHLRFGGGAAGGGVTGRLPDAAPASTARERLHGRPGQLGPAVAPRDDAERRLVEICQDVLGLDRVGVRDDLFELGCDSLLAVQLLARVVDEFGTDLPMKVLLDRPTVEAVAGHLGRRPLNRPPDAGAAGEPDLQPVPAADKERLTPMEYRLWHLEQQRPERARCVVPAALVFRGPVAPEALAAAFRDLQSRHPALRASYPAEGGRPLRRTSPAALARLRRVDLKGTLPTVQDALEANTFRRALSAAQGPFDLARGPLVRLVLFELEPDLQVLLYVMHHLICDGYTMAIFERDLSLLYRYHAFGEAPDLPELPVDYGDYAFWLDRRLGSGLEDRLISFWEERLRGAPPFLDLPQSLPRPATRGLEGESLRFRLSPELAESVRQVARARRVTLFELTLAAYQILLCRLNGGGEVVVGSGVADRSRRAVEEVVGLFVQTMLLRADLKDDPSAATVIHRAREWTRLGHEHREVPVEKLLDTLLEEWDFNRNPFFEAQFGLQSFTRAETRLGGAVEVSRLTLDSPGMWNDLSLYLQEGPSGIYGVWRYRSDLFTRGTVEAMAEAYEAVLEQIVEDPDRPVSSLALPPALRPPSEPLGARDEATT